MAKLIYLGCSLSALTDKPKILAEMLGRELVDLSYESSSNQLQCRRLHSYIVKNAIQPDDMIVWQITGAGRNFLRLPPRWFSKMPDRTTQIIPEFILSESNLFDGGSRIDLLSHSDYLTTYKEIIEFDSTDALEEVLATIVMSKMCCDKIFVYLGWDDVMLEDEKEIFLKKLDERNIRRLSKGSYVGWVKNKNLPMASDQLHPANSSAIQFAEKILFKELNRL